MNRSLLEDLYNRDKDFLYSLYISCKMKIKQKEKYYHFSKNSTFTLTTIQNAFPNLVIKEDPINRTQYRFLLKAYVACYENYDEYEQYSELEKYLYE